MKKIGLTCNTVLKRYGIDRGLEICKESGFDAIDFGFGSYTLKADLGGREMPVLKLHITGGAAVQMTAIAADAVSVHVGGAAAGNDDLHKNPSCNARIHIHPL